MSGNSHKISDSIRSVFSEFLSKEVPQKITSILWTLYRGIQGMFEHLEWKIDLFIRERNILTATHKSSLRTLAAANGYEPNLMIPSSGILKLEVSQKAYNNYGYPLFIPPYAEFKCKSNNLIYYYDSDTALQLTNNIHSLNVVEGSTILKQETGNGDLIQRIYLKDQTISEGSISISVGNDRYTNVKSFYDNDKLNDNKQFLIKFSNNIQTPIIVYIKGVEINQIINISYKVCNGEVGNLNGINNFETSDIIDTFGNEINLSNDEINITNNFGFTLGSNGTTENALRSAIGFNHGNILLFDNTSYQNFINRFSTLLLQKIKVEDQSRQINDIYVSRKVINQYSNNNLSYIITSYKNSLINKEYLLTKSDKEELSKVLSNKEYCLSSHKIFNPEVIKYALQLEFPDVRTKDLYSLKISSIIYKEFSTLLYDRFHKIKLIDVIENFKSENNIKLNYIIFIENSKDNKNTNKSNNNNIIQHDEYLPILMGDFFIKDQSGNEIQLFDDINIVIKS